MEVVHKVKQLHKCHVCSDVEFESEILLNSHIASTHSYMIKCEICDLDFISKPQLSKHMEKNHKNRVPINPDIFHKCQVCSAEFDSEILLNSHFSIHTNVIKCEICDLGFLSQAELWEHLDKDHEWKQLHSEMTKAARSCAQPKNTSEGLIYETIESEDEDTDGGRPENMVGRAVIEPVPLLNLPKPVRLVSLAVLQGIPTIATKESSIKRYSENI